MAPKQIGYGGVGAAPPLCVWELPALLRTEPGTVYRPIRAGSIVSSPGRLSGGAHGREVSENSSPRSEEHTSELQSRRDLVCRLLLEKKKKKNKNLHDSQPTI